MAAITSFHAEKCCHLVNHEWTQSVCRSPIQQRRTSVPDSIFVLCSYRRCLLLQQLQLMHSVTMATPTTFYASQLNRGKCPEPEPPRYLKRDVYNDPDVFAVVDYHAINVRQSNIMILSRLFVFVSYFYTVSGKKRPEYFSHNFDKFRHSFIILARIIPILQCTKTLENLSQHCNTVTWRWRHVWRHEKCPLQTKTDI